MRELDLTETRLAESTDELILRRQNLPKMQNGLSIVAGKEESTPVEPLFPSRLVRGPVCVNSARTQASPREIENEMRTPGKEQRRRSYKGAEG